MTKKISSRNKPVFQVAVKRKDRRVVLARVRGALLEIEREEGEAVPGALRLAWARRRNSAFDRIASGIGRRSDRRSSPGRGSRILWIPSPDHACRRATGAPPRFAASPSAPNRRTDPTPPSGARARASGRTRRTTGRRRVTRPSRHSAAPPSRQAQPKKDKATREARAGGEEPSRPEFLRGSEPISECVSLQK